MIFNLRNISRACFIKRACAVELVSELTTLALSSVS